MLFETLAEIRFRSVLCVSCCLGTLEVTSVTEDFAGAANAGDRDKLLVN